MCAITTALLHLPRGGHGRALESDDIGAIVSGTRIYNLKFVDDIGLLAESSADWQSLVNSTEEESKSLV